MKTIELDEATSPLEKYARKMNKEPVILTQDGRPVAALVAIHNADLETVKLSTNPGFLALVERSRARQRAEGGISSSELRRRLGLKSRKT